MIYLRYLIIIEKKHPKLGYTFTSDFLIKVLREKAKEILKDQEKNKK